MTSPKLEQLNKHPATVVDQLEAIQVECYAGYKANETPRAFIYKERRYNIVEIIDRWYEGGRKQGMPQLNYYKVKTEDNRQYIIRYNHLFNTWALMIELKP